MPAKKIPSDKELERWIREGKTPAEISRLYMEKHNLEISPNAISVWRNRRGLDPVRPTYEELVPWTVRPEHRNGYPLRMLRLEGRRRAGGTLTALETKRLDSWLRHRKHSNTVVRYVPDTEQGWFYVQPRSTDKDLIYTPEPGEITVPRHRPTTTHGKSERRRGGRREAG